MDSTILVLNNNGFNNPGFQHTLDIFFLQDKIFNRLGVAGAVIQTPLKLIDSVSHSAISSKSSKSHNSQTVRARELKF